MMVKCIKCNLHWNISIKKIIHPKGFICPKCIAKMKEENETGRISDRLRTKRIKKEGQV